MVSGKNSTATIKLLMFAGNELRQKKTLVPGDGAVSEEMENRRSKSITKKGNSF